MYESENWKWSHSVVSNPQWPHGLQPSRLLYPWGFPGKSTGVGCHCLLQTHRIDTLNYLRKPWKLCWWRLSSSLPGTIHGRQHAGTTEQKHSHLSMLSWFSRVWLFATLWTVAHLAPLSMGFSRQGYWSGLLWKILLQSIFLIQGLNPHLLHLLYY